MDEIQARRAAAMSALVVRDLFKIFGGIEAVAGVSFSVEAGERRVLIGPNGAGKTTLFHAIAGTHLPTSGSISLQGRDITWLPAHARARHGLARTFQITNLFPHLSVLENLLLAVAAGSTGPLAMIKSMKAYRGFYERAEGLLADWGLTGQHAREVRGLSYGEQRQLELAMALAGSPQLLLLDEPTAGLSASEAVRVVSMVKKLPRDMTVLMIEHDMDVAFELADRVSVLHLGRLVVEGNQQAIRADPKVAEIYLGPE
jgi:branched-chain amino acid transport system ATP-binding protein